MALILLAGLILVEHNNKDLIESINNLLYAQLWNWFLVNNREIKLKTHKTAAFQVKDLLRLKRI